ncbi:MAG TPA: agmatine deiminase family protein [Isosphaeraceae bacterium]|nr:agmatine deiminase family protein [Isosphaeraceae bacterium]
MDPTPAQLGYRMPAEWEPHAATWIAWPHNRDDWPGKFAPIPWVYTEIVRHLCRVELVHIVVQSRALKRRAADRLDAVGVDWNRVRFFKAATDRVWLRDSGPTFVVRDEAAADDPARLGLIEWKFNAWAKYDNSRQDRRLPRRLAKWLNLPRWVPRVEQGGHRVRVVMEGGAIDVNGRGSLLTTEECLLGEVQARNPGLDRAALEQVFADYLGIRHVVWLGRGITGDDTHGHVDDLARFVDPRTVVTVVEPRADDANHEPLQENLRRLQQAHDQDGQPLRVVELPMPRPVIFDGQRLPASYANFYIANGLVLVPTFNDPADRIALETMAQLFPDREVVGIHSLDLVLGLGTLHCLSQQQPAGSISIS